MINSYNAIPRKNIHEEVSNYTKKTLKSINNALKDRVFLFIIIGFLLGRVSILNTFFPFGVAFAMAVSLVSDLKNTTASTISEVFGVLSYSIGYQAIEPVISILAVYLVIRLLKINNKTTTLKAAVIVFNVNVIIGFISNLFKNGSFIMQDALMSIFNSTIAMALVYIYYYSIPVVIEKRKRNLMSNEEIICISIILGIIISGFSDIYIYGLSIKSILSVVVIIITAYGQGAAAGAAIGTVIGLISCISTNQVPYFVGGYSLCGLLSGVFKSTGKVGVCLGFIIADIAMFFYLGGHDNFIGIKELSAGILLFLLIPHKIIEKFIPAIDKNEKDIIFQQSYLDRIRNLIRVRILHINEVFDQLSKALQESEGSEKIRQSNEINLIIDSVTERVCSECDARNICWNRNFYSTYQNMFQLIDIIQTDGKLEMNTVPKDLKKECIKLGQLIKTFNYMFEIYKMNYKWRKKAQEGKKVISDQLECINGVLRRLSDDIQKETNFNNEIEEEIALALDKEGIPFKDIMIMCDQKNRYEVDICRKSCLGKRECIKKIEPVVSKVLKKKMERDKTSCIVKEGTNICYFKLIEAMKYQMTIGIAKEIKEKGTVSGDNYSFIELDGGKYMLILSDGMGTGPLAALESNLAVTLLEKYIEAGFDRIKAIKAINSVMVLNSLDDNYATIDLAIVDLYTGEAEFIKIGAVSTYIKRYEGSVEIISASTLPMGILNDVDVESKTVKLNHGDLLIMITDGVLQTSSDEKEDWIENALLDIKTRNPQQVAEELMARAKQKNKGKIEDDMTIIVSRIWEIV